MYFQYERYRLFHIYQQIMLKQSRLNSYPTSHQQFSAENLSAFIELRNSMNGSFQTLLAEMGLILTHNDFILKGLNRTFTNLGLGYLAPRFDTLPYNQAIQRKHSILHTTLKRPEVMVTLDVNSSDMLIRDFLINGMTIARINCAHGTLDEWKRLIQLIKKAEKQLHITHSPCKIYMDLAGPKIRIGPIKKTTYPLKIKINKDRYGDPIRTKQGLLLVNHNNQSIQEGNDFDFILPLETVNHVPLFQAEDSLNFTDVQNRKRRFIISGRHSNGYIVTINKTTYISQGTPLYHPRSGMNYRIGTFEVTPVDIYVKSGDRLKINLSETIEGHAATTHQPAEIPTTLPAAFAYVRIGDHIFIDDGKIQGVVEQVDQHAITVQIIYPDTPKKVTENKGINLPDTKMNLPFLTNKDFNDLRFICDNADFVGVSFIHRAGDLAFLRSIFPKERLTDLTVVAKIETKEAIHHFSKILFEGLHFPKFAVMVARGDLAIEVGFDKLVMIQQEMLEMCQAAHVPIILATQILDRLAKTGLPSRAELADLLVGSSFDCMMLNKGAHADKAVEFLKETLQLIVQSHQCQHQFVRQKR